ncbi:MAG: methyltransferase domain-containing protein [Phycisphaerales bacterium]|nr:methyltransferase domain-containing protein [Phycisphaerales bacterium]
MPHLTRRTLTPEFIDDPNVDPAGLAESFRYIRSVNRRLAGTAAALKQFKRWARNWNPQQLIRVLDVGTGLADIPLAIVEWAQRNGFRLEVTGIDLHPTTVNLARAAIRGSPNIQIVQVDALKLMDHFQPNFFDYAHAGMFLHHLNDIEVITVLRIMDRLATRGLIWNDLVRGWVGKIGSRLLTMRLPRMVRHDAIVSVNAGFTRREAIDLALRAGLSRVRFRRHLFYRFTLASDKSNA